jgi:hypothetical protein
MPMVTTIRRRAAPKQLLRKAFRVVVEGKAGTKDLLKTPSAARASYRATGLRGSVAGWDLKIVSFVGLKVECSGDF